MPTYVILVNYTQQGIQNIKESPARLDAAKQAFKAAGGELKEWYLKMAIPAGGGLFGLFALAQMVKALFVFIDPSLIGRAFPATGAEPLKPEDPAR